MTRFIDTNVFIYAYLKPKRDLSKMEVEIKEKAREIIRKIDKGEDVVTSVAHLSEIINIIESKADRELALNIILSLLLKENIGIIPVEKIDYINSVEIARTNDIDLNDALAYHLMKKHGITEIYSFDKDFDKLKDIKRISLE